MGTDKRQHEEDSDYGGSFRPPPKVFIRGPENELQALSTDESLSKSDDYQSQGDEGGSSLVSMCSDPSKWFEILWYPEEEESLPPIDVSQKLLPSRSSSFLKSVYFDRLREAFFGEKYRIVLDHLRVSPVVGYVTKELAAFIVSLFKEIKQIEPERMLKLLHVTHCLISNDYVVPAECIIILVDENALLSCLVNPDLSQHFGSHCLLIKEIVADIVSELYRKDPSLRFWSIIFLKLFNSFNNPKNSFNDYYGIIVTALSIGIEVTAEDLFSCLEPLLQYIYYSASQDSPLGYSALRVWNEIVRAYELWSQYCLCQFLASLGSARNRLKTVNYHLLDLDCQNTGGRNISKFFCISSVIPPSNYPLLSECSVPESSILCKETRNSKSSVVDTSFQRQSEEQKQKLLSYEMNGNKMEIDEDDNYEKGTNTFCLPSVERKTDDNPSDEVSTPIQNKGIVFFLCSVDTSECIEIKSESPQTDCLLERNRSKPECLLENNKSESPHSLPEENQLEFPQTDFLYEKNWIQMETTTGRVLFPDTSDICDYEGISLDLVSSLVFNSCSDFKETFPYPSSS